jgi:hypothetical protein
MKFCYKENSRTMHVGTKDIKFYSSATNKDNIDYIIGQHSAGLFINNTETAYFKALLGSKELFIINTWLKENEGSTIRDYASYINLLGRNSALQKWHNNVVGIYSKYLVMPNYVLESPNLQEYWLNTGVKVLETHKQELKKVVDKEANLQKKFKSDMLLLNIERETYIEELTRKHPILAISKITVQGLPIERVVKYNAVSPDAIGEALDKELESYKTDLSNRYLSKEMSIDELIVVLKSK